VSVLNGLYLTHRVIRARCRYPLGLQMMVQYVLLALFSIHNTWFINHENICSLDRGAMQWSFRGGTRGNAVPIVKIPLERMGTAFLLLSYGENAIVM